MLKSNKIFSSTTFGKETYTNVNFGYFYLVELHMCLFFLGIFQRVYIASVTGKSYIFFKIMENLQY